MFLKACCYFRQFHVVSDHILAFFLAMLAVHVVVAHFPRMKNDLKPLVYKKKKEHFGIWLYWDMVTLY